jgi:hypothetical protein
MRTNLAITAALVIMAAASLGIIQSAMATKGTPYDAGYDYKISSISLYVLYASSSVILNHRVCPSNLSTRLFGK